MQQGIRLNTINHYNRQQLANYTASQKNVSNSQHFRVFQTSGHPVCTVKTFSVHIKALTINHGNESHFHSALLHIFTFHSLSIVSHSLQDQSPYGQQVLLNNMVTNSRCKSSTYSHNSIHSFYSNFPHKSRAASYPGFPVFHFPRDYAFMAGGNPSNPLDTIPPTLPRVSSLSSSSVFVFHFHDSIQDSIQLFIPSLIQIFINTTVLADLQ